MINLTTNITQPNITKWEVFAFDVNRGTVTVRFHSSGTLFIDIDCNLSNTVGASTGVKINPTPQAWNDKIISVAPLPTGAGGVGAANSLTNAQNAYRGAANHTAGLRAVEGQGLADAWVDAALTGT